MDDKTLVERKMVAGDIHAGTYADLNRQIEAQATRIEALKADNARARAQGQDEGFAAAVQELRDMSARKPLPTLWHVASVLADSLEQSRIPCQALESQP